MENVTRRLCIGMDIQECMFRYALTVGFYVEFFQAGYFIGQGCNLVLCIQDMQYGVCIDGIEVCLNCTI